MEPAEKTQEEQQKENLPQEREESLSREAPGANGQGVSGQGTNGQGASGQGANGQAASGQGANGQAASGQGANGQSHNHGNPLPSRKEELSTSPLKEKNNGTTENNKGDGAPPAVLEKGKLLAALKQIQPGFKGEYMTYSVLSPSLREPTRRNAHNALSGKLGKAIENEEETGTEELRQLYKEVQQKRISYLKDPGKIFNEKSGSVKADKKAHQIVEGSDIDYRVMRLAALFESNIGQNDRFAALMNWLSTGGLNKKEIEYRYKLIRGKTLGQELKDTYGEGSFRYQFLEQMYSDQGMSKPAELVLELGLLYKGPIFGRRVTHKMDDDRIRKLVEESPEDFTFLAKDTAPDDKLQKEAYTYLKKEKPGLFGELRAMATSLTTTTVAGASYTPKASKKEIKTGNVHADYLISLVVDTTDPYVVENHPGKDPKTTYNYREFDKHDVSSRILGWATRKEDDKALNTKGLVPLQELDRLIKSGEKFIDNKLLASPYTKIWQVLSETLSIRSFHERRIIPQLKFNAGFTDERIKYIVESLKLIHQKRKEEEEEIDTIEKKRNEERAKKAEKEAEGKKEEKETKDEKTEKEKKEEGKKEEEEKKARDTGIREKLEKDTLDKATDTIPIKKLETLLEKQQSKSLLSRKQERTNLKHRILNLLSTSKEWDAQLALLKHYLNENSWEQYEKAAAMYEYDDDDQPVLKTDIKNIFEKKKHQDTTSKESKDLGNDLHWIFKNRLEPKFKKAGLKEHQVAQIRGMVFHRGAFEDKAMKEVDEAIHYGESEKPEKDYNTANYQKLKKEAQKGTSKDIVTGLGAGGAVELLLKAKPDSLDQQLILNDPEIADYLKREINRFNDKERAEKVLTIIENLKTHTKLALPEGVPSPFEGLKSGDDIVLTAKNIKDITDTKKNKEKAIKAKILGKEKSDIWWETETIRRDAKEPAKEYKELAEHREKQWKRKAKEAGAIEDHTKKLKDVKESFETWAKEHETSNRDLVKEHETSNRDLVKELQEGMKSVEEMLEMVEKWKEGVKETKETKETEEANEKEETRKLRSEIIITLADELYEKTSEIIERENNEEKTITELADKLYEKANKLLERKNIKDLERLLSAPPEKRTLIKTENIKQEIEEELQKWQTKAYAKEKEGYETVNMPDKKKKPEPITTETYDKQKLGYWANMLALQYVSERTRHDRNRFLEIAFKAQQDQVDGKELANELFKIDGTAYRVMTTPLPHHTAGENKAVETLKNFFNGDKIKVEELMEASAGHEGMEKFTSDEDALKFAFDDLLDDELLTQWVGESMKKLKDLSGKHFQDKLNSTSGTNTGEIVNFPIKLDPDKEALLHKVAKSENKVFEIKRKIFEKVGKAFIADKTEEIQRLNLPSLEKLEIGMRILAENNIKGFKQTQTGAHWHFWNAAGMVASGMEGNMLNALWKEQPVSADTHGNPEASKDKEERLQDIGELIRKGDEATIQWRDTQDKLNKQVIKIVTTIINSIVAVAGVATGQLYAPIVVKIVWAVIHKAVVRSVEEVMQHALGREGEQDPREFIKDLSIKTLTSILETAITHDFKELAKVELKGIQKDMFNDPSNTLSMEGIKKSLDFKALSAAVKTGFAIPKKELTALGGKAIEMTADTFLKKHPELWSETKGHFSEIHKRELKNIVETTVFNFGRMGYREIHPYTEETKRPKEFGPKLSSQQIQRLVTDIIVEKWLLTKLKGAAGSTAMSGLNMGKALLGESAPAKQVKRKVDVGGTEFDLRENKLREVFEGFNPEKVDEVAGSVMRDVLATLGSSKDKELKKHKDVLEQLGKELVPEERKKLKPILEEYLNALFEKLDEEFPEFTYQIEQAKTETIKKLKDLVDEKKDKDKKEENSSQPEQQDSLKATKDETPGAIGTGLPKDLKTSVENLSGHSMDDVDVHYDSDEPTKLNAKAYTQDTDIHLAPGQEEHLPHEAWHVVQQKQGKVKPTAQMLKRNAGIGKRVEPEQNRVNINDEVALEKEADLMGMKALQMNHNEQTEQNPLPSQRKGKTPPANPEPTESGLSAQTKETTPSQSIKTQNSVRMDSSSPIQFAKGHKRPAESPSPSTAKKARTNILDAEYWVRAMAKPNVPGTSVKAEEVKLGTVWISDKRRLTAQGAKQGDHIVAWSAMVAFWNQHLTGLPLNNALGKLQEWLLKDQISDQLTGGSPEDKSKRMKALSIIEDALKNEDTLENKMTQFEIVVSLFVETNQHSQFATIGKASGGHGEASARENLKALNEKAKDKDVDPATISSEAVKENALTLLDIGKVTNKDIVGKAVSAWFEMLTSSYEGLNDRNKFDEVKNHVIKGKPVEQWVKDADIQYREKKSDYLEADGSLKAPVSISDLLKEQHSTLVKAGLTSNRVAGTTEYKPSDVTLEYIEVPDVRSKTQFGELQGAHTIAWTFKRQSLQSMFKGITYEEALDTIEELVKTDAKDIDKMGGKTEIIEKAKELQTKALSRTTEAKGEKNTLTNWKLLIENILGVYIEENQLLPVTTYYGAFNPTGHAEGATNTKFAHANPYDKPTHYNGLVEAASQFVDLGILYLPLLHDASAYAANTKLGDPLKSGKEGEENGKLDKAISDNLKEAEKIKTDSTQTTNKVFSELLGMERFSSSAIGKQVKGLPIDKFDELMNTIQDVHTHLSGGLDHKDPLKDIAIDHEKKSIAEKFIQNKRDPSGEVSAKEIEKKSKRLEKLKETLENYRDKDPAIKVEAARRQKDLGEKLKDPKEYFDKLYEEQGSIISKIIGEYWHHLHYYHSGFFNDLKDDKASKIQILKKIFLDPIDLKDEGIGKPIQSHLMDNYNAFIVEFRKRIKEKIAEDAETLMPSPMDT